MRTRFSQLLLCFVLLVALSLSAHSATPPTDEPAGIKFFTGSWKDVLAEAKRQNKPVFVDIFTTWCGPCKLMAKQAFPDPKVGEKFNAHFISYQIDAEKGEGLEVAKKYAVQAYPTSLYVSANGDLIHRAIGYGGIKGMLEEADKAIEAAKDPTPLSVMEKQYEGGKREPDFLAAYLQKRTKVGMPNGDALDAYLKTVPESEWTSDKNLELIAGNLTTSQSKAYDVMLRYAPQLRKTGMPSPAFRPVISGLRQANQNDLKKAIATKDDSQLERLVANERAYWSLMLLNPPAGQIDEITNSLRMRYYQQTKNIDKYRMLASDEASKLMAISRDSVKIKDKIAYERFQKQSAMMPDSVKKRDDFKEYAANMNAAESKQMAMKLNNLAWSFYEAMTDPKDLNQALTWSTKSLEYDRSSGYLDTYAHLLSKLGRKAEAIKTQEEAIAKEKANGGDTANYEKELELMKKK